MKYLLDPQQKEKMLQAMEPYMSLDQYGRTTIRNLYFDTDTYRLVRHSIEKPAYKSCGSGATARPCLIAQSSWN